MASSRQRVTVPGSKKKALRAAKVLGKINPKRRIEITLVLRPRITAHGPRTPKAASAQVMAMGRELPEQRQYLSREEFAAQRGADPRDVAQVEAFAQEHHLTIVEASLAKRTLRLEGSVADLTAAFRPKLKKVKLAGRRIRMRTGSIWVPEDLHEIIVAVLGFDDRPAARSHYRFLEGTAPPTLAATANGSTKATKKKARKRAPSQDLPTGILTAPEVARLYNFPTGLDGEGQCIALIELNDFDKNHRPVGTGFSLPDLKAYFASLGLPMPDVTAIGVASSSGVGANIPGEDPEADGEVMLDIEVAGAVAPKAKLAVYFALGTDDSFLAALNAALHDDLRKPSVIGISWGSAEDFSTKQTRRAFRDALIDAAQLGVTVCCATGDFGSSDLPPDDRDRRLHVHFPASIPFALACGGTTLRASASTITSEVVWNQGNATGGGVSNHFPRPPYQSRLKVPKSPKGKVGRGVPDVAGSANPTSAYRVTLVGGHRSVIGGTSAVTALWAGLIALFNQRLASLGKKSVGFLNPLLYHLSPATGALRDIVEGNNDIENLGKYNARPGWDPCTGLGTPDGAKLLMALGG